MRMGDRLLMAVVFAICVSLLVLEFVNLFVDIPVY